jgi:hypothetical protein
VQQRSHGAAIEPMGDRPVEARRQHPAGPAEPVVRRTVRAGERMSAQRFAAAWAERSGLRGKIGPATFADWHTGEAQQGVRTKSTVGRKDGAAERVNRTSKGARDGAPPGGSGLWNVERQCLRLTTEDAPHCGTRDSGARVRCCLEVYDGSSDRASDQQCGSRSLKGLLKAKASTEAEAPQDF